MTIRYRYVEVDGSIGCEYTFEKSGEHIPSHRHPEHLRHSIRCVHGRAWLEVDKQWFVIQAGEEMSAWDSTHPHTIAALEDNTVIVNKLLTRPSDAQEWLKDSGVEE